MFEGIVRPGIKLLLFGFELQPRELHFLICATPRPLGKKVAKRTKSERTKHQSFGLILFVLFSYSFLDLFFVFVDAF